MTASNRDRKDNRTASAVIERLFAVIESRRGADPAASHTAALFAKGRDVIARKVGEEAMEVVIEGARGERRKLVTESADLIYHLLVLWADAGVAPDDVWEELARREGTSGIEEKKSRGR